MLSCLSVSLFSETSTRVTDPHLRTPPMKHISPLMYSLGPHDCWQRGGDVVHSREWACIPDAREHTWHSWLLLVALNEPFDWRWGFFPPEWQSQPLTDESYCSGRIGGHSCHTGTRMMPLKCSMHHGRCLNVSCLDSLWFGLFLDIITIK